MIPITISNEIKTTQTKYKWWSGSRALYCNGNLLIFIPNNLLFVSFQMAKIYRYMRYARAVDIYEVYSPNAARMPAAQNTSPQSAGRNNKPPIRSPKESCNGSNMVM